LCWPATTQICQFDDTATNVLPESIIYKNVRKPHIRDLVGAEPSEAEAPARPAQKSGEQTRSEHWATTF